MDTDSHEPAIPDSLPVESTPKKTPKMLTVIAIIAFVFICIAVNATVIYFGSKKSSANAPTENPVTMPGDNTGNIPVGELNTVLPEDMGENPNAVLDNTITSENPPSDIAPELPPNEVIPENTEPTQ